MTSIYLVVFPPFFCICMYVYIYTYIYVREYTGGTSDKEFAC